MLHLKKISTLTLAFYLLSTTPSLAENKWGYDAETGFQHWGGLDDKHSACDAGEQQSPINISDLSFDETLSDLKPDYTLSNIDVVNNGHTLQANVQEGSSLMVGDERFELLQFHFHTPSEHYINGTPFPMEVHFVHRSQSGELAVLGVMFKVGEANPALDTLWEAAGSDTPVSVSTEDLLPQKLNYFRYDGSLTTPPCSEGVKWHVVPYPVSVSEEQLLAFQGLFPVNARPIQPKHGRVVRTK